MPPILPYSPMKFHLFPLVSTPIPPYVDTLSAMPFHEWDNCVLIADMNHG